MIMLVLEWNFINLKIYIILISSDGLPENVLWQISILNKLLLNKEKYD